MSKMIVFVLFLFPVLLSANDCYSELNAHLKPVSARLPGLQWSTELSLSGGGIQSQNLNRYFSRELVFALFDLQWASHQFVIEGGLKYWYRSDEGPGGGGTGGYDNYKRPRKRHAGMRELYYQYSGENTVIRTGLQSMNQSLLLDERVLGFSMDYKLPRMDLAVRGGTVSTQFSRMNDFCGTRHIYRVIRGGRFDLVGRQPGETNFAAAVLAWTPGAAAEISNANLNDLSFDSFGSVDSEKESALKKIGWMTLHEFGSGFHASKLYSGLFSYWEFPGSVNADVQLFYQYLVDDHCLGFKVAFDRSFSWKGKSVSILRFSWYGTAELQSGSRFYPSFSNIYAGDWARLDALHMPFYVVEIRHSIGNPTLYCRWVSQTELDHSTELDAGLNLKIYKGWRLYAQYSIFSADILDHSADLFKLETRLTL